MCWAGLLALGIGLLCKNKKQKGSAGALPLLLRCLSQFFPVEENINCLGNEVLCISLRNKVVLLDRARCEASEAESSIERLIDECHALRGDLQRQEALVIQRDGAIASLRDEACTRWASGWLAFQRRVANAYLGLDLNFDIPRLIGFKKQARRPTPQVREAGLKED